MGCKPKEVSLPLVGALLPGLVILNESNDLVIFLPSDVKLNESLKTQIG